MVGKLQKWNGNQKIKQFFLLAWMKSLPFTRFIKMKELTIVRAAIRTAPHDAIFSLPIPARHHDCIRELRESGYEGPVQGDRQGFLLSDGRFVMRKAAGSLARKNGQLKNGKQISSIFTSEDIW